MNKFSIDVQKVEAASDNDAHGIALRCHSHVFTRLLRPGEEQFDDYLRAPPSQLAFWLVDNWWRLRHECVPPGSIPADWRLAHDVASVGGGYVWPRLTIWGEGERVGLACRSDPAGVVGPVRYVTDALLFIVGTEFEEAVDTFLALVNNDEAFGSDRGALQAQHKALRAERQDPEFSAWRRVEAQLGFDPDEAPEALMNALAGFVDRYGSPSVEEAVQAYPGIDSVKILNAEIEAVKQSGWDCDFTAAVRASTGIVRNVGEPPWRLAEEAGSRLREALSIGSGPISNQTLASIAEIDSRSLHDTSTAHAVQYGLRLQGPKGSKSRLVFRARWAASKRFELSRAIGDAIWGKSDMLGPLARSRTARQKFQRAFAQNLLCPFSELMSYMGTSQPTDDDIAAAARHFDVSERVIQTTLVNNHVIQRERFEDLVEAA